MSTGTVVMSSHSYLMLAVCVLSIFSLESLARDIDFTDLFKELSSGFVDSLY